MHYCFQHMIPQNKAHVACFRFTRYWLSSLSAFAAVAVISYLQISHTWTSVCVCCRNLSRRHTSTRRESLWMTDQRRLLSRRSALSQSHQPTHALVWLAMSTVLEACPDFPGQGGVVGRQQVTQVCPDLGGVAAKRCFDSFTAVAKADKHWEAQSSLPSSFPTTCPMQRKCLAYNTDLCSRQLTNVSFIVWPTCLTSFRSRCT